MPRLQWMLMGLTLLFFVVPGRAGIADGIPLDNPHEILLPFALLVIFALLPPLGEGEEKARKSGVILCGIFVVLIMLKIAAGQSSLLRGLIGTHQVPGQEKTEVIRRDTVIDFTNKGYDRESEPMPIGFVNDNTRFNETDLDRTTLPFTASWQGYIWFEKPGTQDIRLDADGKADVKIAGQPMNTFSAPETGAYPIEISYVPGADRNRVIRIETERSREPITDLFPEKHAASAIRRDAYIGWLAGAVTLGGILAAIWTLVILSKGVRREWFASWRPWACALGIACLAYLALGAMERGSSLFFSFLPSGSDELSYETFARHIAKSGDWAMLSFEKSAYYYQLYYYFLAGFHAIAGEGLFGIVLIQACLLAAAGFGIGKILQLFMAPEGRIRNTWIAVMAIAGVILTPELGEEMFHIMPTITGIFFAVWTATLLVMADRQESGRKTMIFLAGICTTLGVMNRYNFLAWIPLILLWLATKHARIGWKQIAIFMLGLSLSMAPIMIRNKIVADQWRLVTRWNSTINFIKGTPVPETYAPERIIDTDQVPILRSIVDGQAARNVQWIIDEPWQYAKLLTKKARFAVTLYPVLWTLFAIASLAWLMKPSFFWKSIERKDYILIGGFVLTQFAAITVFSINNERYYQTLLPFLVLTGAMTLDAVMRSIRRTR